MSSRLSLLISSVLAARLFALEGYGAYATLHSTVSAFTAFAGLGLGATMTRYLADYKEQNKKRAGRLLSLTLALSVLSGALIATLVAGLSRPIAANILHDANLEPQIKLVALHLLVASLSITENGILVGFESFRAQAFNGILTAALSIPVNLTGILLGGLNGLLIANIMLELILFLLHLRQIALDMRRYQIHMEWDGLKREFRVIWNFSLPALITSVLYMPIVWLANAVITGTPNGYAELGYFNAAAQWRNLMLYLPNSAGNALTPKLIVGLRRKADINEYYNLIILPSFIMSISGFVMAFPEVFMWIFGAKYLSRTFYLTIILAGVVLPTACFRTSISRQAMCHEKLWFAAMENLIWGFLLYGFTVLLKDYGSIGLSTAYIIAYICASLITIPFYLKNGVINKRILFLPEHAMLCIIFIIFTLFAFTVRPLLLRLTILLLFWGGIVFLITQSHRKVRCLVEEAENDFMGRSVSDEE